MVVPVRASSPRNVRVQYSPGFTLHPWLVSWTLGPREMSARFRNEDAARLLHRNLLQMDAVETPLTFGEAELIIENAKTLDKNLTEARQEEQEAEKEAIRSLGELGRAIRPSVMVRKYKRHR